MTQTGPASEMSIFKAKKTVTATFYFSPFSNFFFFFWSCQLQHARIGVCFSFNFGLSPTYQTNDQKKQRETKKFTEAKSTSPRTRSSSQGDLGGLTPLLLP